MPSISNFYSAKKLTIVKRNAKKITSDPILANVEHIREQVNNLKACHRRFIFALLAEKYGDDKARSLAQSEKVKELIDSFEDLDKEALKLIDREAKKLKNDPNPLAKLKHSFYYKPKHPKTIIDELLENSKELIPDLLKPTVKPKAK